MTRFLLNLRAQRAHIEGSGAPGLMTTTAISTPPMTSIRFASDMFESMRGSVSLSISSRPSKHGEDEDEDEDESMTATRFSVASAGSRVHIMHGAHSFADGDGYDGGEALSQCPTLCGSDVGYGQPRDRDEVLVLGDKGAEWV